MKERSLSPAMRVLAGAFGVGVLGLGLLLAATELRWAYRGAPLAPALLMAGGCGLAAVGGGALVRGAIRGRMAVRRTRFRPAAK